MFSILYVDDEPGLLEIGKLFLEQGGRFTVDTLTSATEALEVLGTKHYDAIISDYQMPVMNGIEFLKSVRASGNTVPFIIFTGRGREEVVIQALNEGADFYLQKGGEPVSQFAELGHKLQTAILQRSAEASIRDHERREADIINFLPDATFAIDRAGRVISWNRAIEEMTGIPASQMLGKGDHEYAIPFYGMRRPILIDLIYESDEVIAEKYSHIIHEKNVLIADTPLPRPRGKPLTLMGKASPLYNRQGEIVGAIESIRDITQMKNAEERVRESEDRFSAFMERIPVTAFIKDDQSVNLFVNRYMKEVFGSGEWIGKSVRDLFPEEAAEKMIEDDRQTLRDGYVKAIETLRGINGEQKIFETYKFRIDRENKPPLIGGFAVDITERKAAEEALHESERRFRDLSDLLPQGVYEADTDGNLKYVNHIAFEQFGYSEDDFKNGLSVLQMIAPGDRERAAAGFGALVKGTEKTRGADEYLALRKDGSTFPVSIYSSLVFTNDRVTGLRGIIVDITERKAAEDEIRNSFAFLNSLIDQSPTPMWISDERGTLIRINRACCELLQVSEADVVGKYSIFDDNIVTEQGFLPRVREVFEKGVVAQFQMNYDTSRLTNLGLDKHVSVILDVTIFPVRDNHGKITNAVIQHANITGRRKAEAALIESEQKYRTVFETTGTAMVLIENTSIISLANSEFVHLSGYGKDEIENRMKWTEFVVKEDLDRMLGQHRLRRQNRQEALTHYEFRFRTRSGEVRDIYLTIDVIPGTTKSVASLLDITERKRGETCLVAANQEYTNLLDQIQDVYYRSDAEGRLIKASRSLATLLGYDDLSECLGRNIAGDFYAKPEDRKLFTGEVYRNGQVTDYEVELKRKDGSSVLIATSSHLYRDTSGTVLGIEGTFRDITERKGQENILRVQRDLGIALQTAHGMNKTLDLCLDAAIEISGLDAGGIYLVDERNGALDLAVSRNLGADFTGEVSRYTVNSGNGRIVMAGEPIYTRFDMTGVIHNTIQQQEGLRASAIVPITFKDRKTACLNLASHTLDEIPANARIALETIATQIGSAIERIRADEALAESEERYRNIVEDQTEFICRFRPDGTHVFVNEAYCRYFGLRREDLIGNRFRPEIPRKEREHLKRFFASLTPDHPVDTIEHEIIMPDGRIRWQRWSDRAIFGPTGSLTEYQSVGRDITGSKQAEAALRIAQEKYTKAFHSVPDAMTISELDSGRFVEVNEAATVLFGYSREELMGKSAAGLGIWLNKEDRNAFMDLLKKNGRIQEYEVVEKRKSGELYNAVINADTLTIGDREYLISVIRDITERKRGEQVIKEAHRKINLLTSITRHDVANQISILRGFTRLALQKKPDKVIAGFLEKIDEAVSTIARQIEFTRAYQELGIHAPGWQNISDIVTRQKAEGISLSCTCDAEVFADPMLEQVFFNLIDNAVRHGETVTAITVSCRPDPDGLVIVVSDNGIGVPQELKETIFEKGYGKNTGFGLFLAREILAITGIIILETGTCGKGAQFEIIVPPGMYRIGA